MRKVRNPILIALAAGFTPALLIAAAARADQSSTPCVTQSECDARVDAADQAARNAQWKKGVQLQADMAAHRAEARADAYNQAESGKLSRVQEVMRRRRERAAAAAAAAAKP